MTEKIYDRRQTPTPCKWALNADTPSPHEHREHASRPKICKNILEAVGHTPMVRINNITAKDNIQCEVLVKCEFLNPGGSVKDRIGVRMIEDAESKGIIRPGFTLIEPTSGNTGIGLAVTAAAKGYRLIVTLPEKMSQEKSDTMKALGAEIIRTPTEAAFDSPESHICTAERLEKELPDSKILDQYSNVSNPLAHYDFTAEEIIDQCDGRIDYCVIGAGTGGTLTGISRKLKEKLPNVQIVGVDPEGSIIASPETDTASTYKVEGIGYDFVPRVCYTECVDRWFKSSDQNSFLTSRRLIKEEGLLVGGSSGSAMWAALELAKELPSDKRVVVVLPDSIRNYMTKFINDQWMVENGFIVPTDEEFETHGKLVRDMELNTCQSVSPFMTCADALEVMRSNHYDQLPVVDGGSILGVVTIGNISAKLASRRVKKTDPVNSFMYKSTRIVTMDTPLSLLVNIFESNHFVLVNTGQYIAVVTPVDLIKYLETLES